MDTKVFICSLINGVKKDVVLRGGSSFNFWDAVTMVKRKKFLLESHGWFTINSGLKFASLSNANGDIIDIYAY